MMLTLASVAVLATLSALPASSSHDWNWDDLRVTWSPEVWEKKAFERMPRTLDDAKSKGWTRLDNQCGSPGAKFRGVRVWLNNDPAVILLFDPVGGFIVGIQTSAPGHLYTPPTPSRGKAFQADDGRWTLTAYFVDPKSICTSGRSPANFHEYGTGTTLRLQTGPNPETDNMEIPHEQSTIEGIPQWGNGKCFWSMGKHYWYNLHEDMACDDFFPFFVLYNKGKLNAFGFAIGTDALTSPRYEHPDAKAANLCCLNAPKCFYSDPKYAGKKQSTLHVFFWKYPWLFNHC